MTILKYTLAMLLLGLLPFFAQAQDYYIQKDDAGLNTAPYQDSLEQHAKDLVFAIPEGPLRDAFRVYGFGFYQHSEATDGYPAAFEKMRTQIASETPYYLIFGKQTDKSGVYTRFWVDLKLPEGGRFGCLTQIQREFLSTNFSKIAYDYYSKEATKYVDTEIYVIDSLKNKILQIIDCCVNRNNTEFSCSNCLSSEEMESLLLGSGFETIDDIVGVQKAVINQPISTQNNKFINYSGFDFSFGIIDESLISFLNAQNLNYQSNNIPNLFLLSGEADFCDEDYLLAKNEFNNSIVASSWFIIGPDGKYYVKSKPEVTGFDDEWDDEIQCYCKNKSRKPYNEGLFNQFVFNTDPSLFMAFNKSTCSSLWNLQKNANSSKWDNGFVGVPAEAIAMEIVREDILKRTFWTEFESKSAIKKIPDGVLKMLEAGLKAWIWAAPDPQTDYAMYLGKPTGNNVWGIGYWKLDRNGRLNAYKKSGSYPGDEYHRQPFNREETFTDNTLLCVEVKYSAKDKIFFSVEKGIAQVLRNPLVKNGAAIYGSPNLPVIPVVQADLGNFFSGIKGITDERYDIFNGKTYLLQAQKGGIWLDETLNRQTNARLTTLISAIKNDSRFKAPNGYYDGVDCSKE